MSDVVRYTPDYDKHKMVVIDSFIGAEDGEWVCATDYQAMADQLAACEATLAAVMEDAKIESQRRRRAEQKLEQCEASIAQAELRALDNTSEKGQWEKLEAAYLEGLVYGIKHMSTKEEWPLSWDAKFPGIKAQALIDRAEAIMKEKDHV